MEATRKKLNRTVNLSADECIDANNVDKLLSIIPRTVNTISFDCFDTIIWRKAAEPTDVFYSLSQHPIAKQYNISTTLRSLSEKNMYQYNKASKGHSQTTLQEIYQHAFPNLPDTTIQALCSAELETELNYCFAYQPIVNLILKLHRKGYKIIVVSDTYFTRSELKTILSTKLPPNAYQTIHQIYTSSDYHTGKTEQLFKTVLKKQKVSPQSILHLGDNRVADVLKPRSLGIHAVQFQQYSPTLSQTMRMQALAACFVDPSIRSKRSLTIPFKALYAASTYTEQSPEQIGYHSVGPVLLAYAQYVIDSYQALTQAGRRVKIAYLLRDGYLPSLACETLDPTLPGKRVRISRFSAFAASFTNSHDIDTYIASRLKSDRFQVLCKQLLLPEDIAAPLIKKTIAAEDPGATFSRLIHQPSIEKIIFTASARHREQLFNHLKNELQLESGDTLMFVDLGYTGTAQIRLSKLLKEQYNIDIVGRYLISLNTPHLQVDKAGLLDINHYDDKRLTMLSTYISLFEQICTSIEKSVLNFDEHGNPVYTETSVNNNQLEKIKPIHVGALAFIKDAMRYLALQPNFLTPGDYRDLAALNLTRLIYLPTTFENNYFSSFAHDVNMGTDDVLELINIEKSADNLKKRSWLYSLRETSANSRMNYPAEWRAISLELSILLMAQHSFHFKVTPNDLSHKMLTIQVVMQTQNDTSVINLEAHPSYEGYYSLIIPIPPHNRIGIQFGKLFTCTEIYKIEKIPLKYFNTNKESDYAEEVSDELILSEMQLLLSCLLIAESEQALLIFNPNNSYENQTVLRIIFRPIAEQSSTLNS